MVAKRHLMYIFMCDRNIEDKVFERIRFYGNFQNEQDWLNSCARMCKGENRQFKFHTNMIDTIALCDHKINTFQKFYMGGWTESLLCCIVRKCMVSDHSSFSFVQLLITFLFHLYGRYRPEFKKCKKYHQVQKLMGKTMVVTTF